MGRIRKAKKVCKDHDDLLHQLLDTRPKKETTNICMPLTKTCEPAFDERNRKSVCILYDASMQKARSHQTIPVPIYLGVPSDGHFDAYKNNCNQDYYTKKKDFQHSLVLDEEQNVQYIPLDYKECINCSENMPF